MKTSILTRKNGRAGRISLVSSATPLLLDRNMCEDLIGRLLAWLTDEEVELVIVDHAHGTAGFCAGVDMSVLASYSKALSLDANAFLETEYRLMHLISRYPKPMVMVMDGVAAGAGLGFSVLASHRIATERTVASVPGTAIGLIPDAGATWFLPRLEGELGTWLALTGAEIKGVDVAAIGLATHFCSEHNLSDLKSCLAVDGIQMLRGFRANKEFSLQNRLKEMNRVFDGCCAQTILDRLEDSSDWAFKQARKLRARSPMSTKIALRLMRTGRILGSVGDALRMEYRIGSRLIHTWDFHEGVRARFEDKDFHPMWKPASLKGAKVDMVGQYFAPLRSGELSFAKV